MQKIVKVLYPSHCITPFSGVPQMAQLPASYCRIQLDLLLLHNHLVHLPCHHQIPIYDFFPICFGNYII